MLELGGYNPLIILADVDLDYAVNATTFGAFLHQGQICMSARKIIVERLDRSTRSSRSSPRRRRVLRRADPKEHDTIIGPLINQKCLQMGGSTCR